MERRRRRIKRFMAWTYSSSYGLPFCISSLGRRAESRIRRTFKRIQYSSYGNTPRTSPDQFISPEIVELAMNTKIKPYYRSPLVLGVDVSRQGEIELLYVQELGLLYLIELRK